MMLTAEMHDEQFLSKIYHIKHRVFHDNFHHFL